MAVLDWFYCILKNLTNPVNTLYIFSSKGIHNITVKPVLSGHLKIDKTKVLMENGSLMKVESIAECSLWSILQYFWPGQAIIGIENQFWCSFE